MLEQIKYVLSSITNVLYAPRLVKTLFSLRQTISMGYIVEFEEIYCTI